MKEIISFSNCIFDVDNRYAHLTICKSDIYDLYYIKMTDTSDDEKSDTEIELRLTKQQMKLVVELLTKDL